MKWKPAVITCQCTLSKTPWLNFCQKDPAKYRFVYCVDISAVCCRPKITIIRKKNDSELERADLHDQEWSGWPVIKDKLLTGKLLSSLALCRNMSVILLMFFSIGRWVLPMLMIDMKLLEMRLASNCCHIMRMKVRDFFTASSQRLKQGLIIIVISLLISVYGISP